MIYLYTNKQVFGAFILLVLLMILILVNIGINDIGNTFSMPVIISVVICLILYYTNLNESIKLRKKSILDVDKFEINSCPTNYEYISEGDGEGEGKVISCNLGEGNDTEGMIQSFILNSDPNNPSCNTDAKISNNGCFNRFPLRITKCSKIQNFFENSEGNTENKNTLGKWTDFQNECNNRIL